MSGAVKPSAALPPARVVIGGVEPAVDGGRFAVKRAVGEPVAVTATLFADGHERVAGALGWRRAGARDWIELPLAAAGNDRFVAEFTPDGLGRFEYVVHGWLDRFATWSHGLRRKVDAGRDVRSELLEGGTLAGEAARRASGADAGWLEQAARRLAADEDPKSRVQLALDPELAARMARHPDRSAATTLERPIPIEVERELAAFGAWYECFPRSTAREPGRHGTLRDLEARLPYVAGMGFDVLYLPPIHPIGTSHRKGRNNRLKVEPGDPGSPWAIGGPAGGHTAIHPELGTLADFDRLVARAKELKLEIALDVAFQCSPDHPWVVAHPEWFRHRPDGTIQYAENPPKRYEDIYPFEFDSPHWRELWNALRDVVLFWVERGVHVFRVDNPHTKPLPFWEWLIAEVRGRHPQTIFLAEAFTRPNVMYHLAKSGYSQSYTYFTWRNTKAELTAYLTELARPPVVDFLRPNFFVNTPDILHETLQHGGRAASQARLVLAATLAGSYGVYGPPFELGVSRAVPGSEEYQDSEKYEVRHWDLDAPDSLAPLLRRVNEIRRENPAFRDPRGLRFLAVDDEALLAYLRTTRDGSDAVLVVVSLDPHHVRSGHVELPLAELGIDERLAYQVEDLLGGARYLWQGARNYVELDPKAFPAHVFRLRRRVRTERDFDYYL